MTIDQVTNCC